MRKVFLTLGLVLAGASVSAMNQDQDQFQDFRIDPKIWDYMGETCVSRLRETVEATLAAFIQNKYIKPIACFLESDISLLSLESQECCVLGYAIKFEHFDTAWTIVDIAKEKNCLDTVKKIKIDRETHNTEDLIKKLISEMELKKRRDLERNPVEEAITRYKKNALLALLEALGQPPIEQ